MKKLTILLLCSIFGFSIAFSQSNMPTFLSGTWKHESENVFEHWDILSNNQMKGFSYFIENGEISVIEYLSIDKTDNKTNYQASVIGQNKGKSITFELSQKDSLWVFENSNHDFPKKISYHIVNKDVVSVLISDNRTKNIRYTMHKQNKTPKLSDSSVSNINYDEKLAKQLGADEYGMKNYILVLLHTGKANITDKAYFEKCFQSHFDHMEKLKSEGKLIVTGPISSNSDALRGLFILATESIEEAVLLLKNDLVISENILEASYYNWYGSAALPESAKISDKIWKKKPNN